MVIDAAVEATTTEGPMELGACQSSMDEAAAGVAATPSRTMVASASLWATIVALLIALCAPATASAQLDFDLFDAPVLDQHGHEEAQAGAHPFEAVNVISVSPDGFTGVSDTIKEVVVDMPVGFAGDASKIPTCRLDELTADRCPRASRIGTFIFSFPLGSDAPRGVYNMEVPWGQPARFGTVIIAGQANVFFHASVRPGDHGITVKSTDIANFSIYQVKQTELRLWGVPADAAHDAERGGPAGVPAVPFLTMPTQCDQPIVTRMRANSWRNQDVWVERSYVGPAMSGCEALDFRPDVKVQPRSSAPDSPSGYTVELSQTLSESARSLSSAHLKDVTVRLPEGVSINPAAANGLAACSEAQLGLGQEGPAQCPQSSKIGEVTVQTPVLDEPLTGAVYQAAQDANPFGSTFALYLVPESERYGVRLKLAGEVKADPVTGQLTTTFTNNPQQPFSRLTLTLKGGDRAVLVNPASCGPKTTSWSMSSWAQPDTPVSGTDSFAIDCRPGLGAFGPSFEAGSAVPVGGAFSPFVLGVDKPDGQSALDGVELKLPEGLLASLKGNLGTRVGTASVGAGPGSDPYWLSGPVVLEGAYGDAPYSLRVTVPVKAGPFDLGEVVVRQKVYVDPTTAEVRVVSDPLPTIVAGVPVRLQSLRVAIDKPGFVRNPTSCAVKTVGGTLGAATGQTAAVSTRFQVGDCQALPFQPRLGLRLTGRRQVRTGRHPGVRAVVRQAGSGEAGIGRAVVRLPKSLALDPDNAGALCEYEDGTKPDLERHCPAGSIVGRARAKTPLLDRDLVGNVYFVKNVRRDARTGNEIRTLPMIVVALRGEIAINLRGESSTTRNGTLVNTFATVPDAPIARFNLNIGGGGDGILVVTRTRQAKINLCANPRGQVANTAMRGHNGKRRSFKVRVKTPCTKKQVRNARRAAAA